jgi:hypothetical protein
MQRRDLLRAVGAAGLCLLPTPSWAAERLVVIAHPRAPASALGAAEVETIFTTRKLFWADGSRIIAFNLPPRSALRVSFDEAALHLSPDEVARFWIDRRVRGGQPPPRQVPDLEMMLRVVAKVEGAVGYAPLSSAGGELKRLAQF